MPNAPFWQTYVRSTRQNTANFAGHKMWRQPGVYLFRLTASFDSKRLPDDIYVLVATETDTRGNSGTGRIVFSLSYSEADVEEVLTRFVAAAKHMQDDSYFWCDPALTNAAIQRQVARDVIASFFPARQTQPAPQPHPQPVAPAARRVEPAAALDGRV